MSERDPKNNPFYDDPIVFDLESTVSSGELAGHRGAPVPDLLDLEEMEDEEIAEQAAEEISPIMKELASVELPPLERENRARLQMQSPNRLFFYWSIKGNPFQTLGRALGGNMGSYALVLKLINVSRDTDEIHPVEAEGTWWFSVDADSSYRAEIGFYAPNRPYVRVMYSNTVTTPRKRPSPRVALASDWKVNVQAFTQVLDVSGFKLDAFEVALSGDTSASAPSFDHEQFARSIDRERSDFAGIASDELRYALLLIASGASIEDLRHRIDASLFGLLQSSADKLSSANVLAALKDQFGIETEDLSEEELGSAVYGASLLHFPRRPKRKRNRPDLTEYYPLSSVR